jgi:hypothetical protein
MFIGLGSTVADVCLLLSAYSPLFLIAWIRAEDCSVKHWLLGLGAGFTLALAIPVLGAVSRAKEDFKVGQVENAAGEVAAYVATYILPFLVVGDKKPADFAAYALLLTFIGVILVRGDLLHYNPWIFMGGRRIFTVRVADSTYYLISPERPPDDSEISAWSFGGRFLLQ